MVQSGQYFSFALEPGEAIGIRGHRLWQHLDGDLPL
jgi:hypothetical protein